MLSSARPSRTLPWLLASALVASVAFATSPDSIVTAPSYAEETYAALGIPKHAVVDKAVARLTVNEGGSRFVAQALVRRPDFHAFVQTALAEAGLPLELEAVALIESGFDDLRTTAELGADGPIGGPSGAGLWMFIPATAREYGLRVDAEVDERLDLEKETAAAVALLSDLHGQFGDWGLALAAYNQGPRAVQQAIDTVGSRDVPTLVEAEALNGYVPMVWAAMLILAE